MNKVYFFDTYAFFEIIQGNPGYEQYKDAQAITTILNIAELNYGLKKKKGKKIADKYADKYRNFVVDISVEDVKKAMDLKVKYKFMSIPDVIGYIIAKKFKVKFLTGDEDFRKIPNVEFVK